MKWTNWLTKKTDKVLKSSDMVDKKIELINRDKEKIINTENEYFLKEADLLIYKKVKFNFVLDRLELLVSNKKKLSGSYKIVNDELYFYFDNKVLLISNVSDIFIINEIFVERCYNFKLPFNESVVIIDIGMNVGLASLFFAEKSQVNKVYAFEPFLPTYELAFKNFELNPNLSKKIKAYNFGLGKKDERISVNYNSEKPGINTTLNKSPWFENDIYEEIEIKSAIEVILEIIKEVETSSSIALKIDCEGAEYAIFESLFSQRLPEQIKMIILEWHFQGSDKLEEPLLMNGFKIFSTSLGKDSGLIYATR